MEIKLCDEVRKKAEINMMKVIHDLKNPILAIEELVNDRYDDDSEELQEKTSKNEDIS